MTQKNAASRSPSARLLGDSKALERSIRPLLTYLRHVGVIGCDLSRDDALERLGLTKYAQPVLAAGPLIVGDVGVPRVLGREELRLVVGDRHG